MPILNSTKKYTNTLVAISTNDKLNSQHKKSGEYFHHNNQIYWPIGGQTIMPDFAYDLLNFMSTQKQPININIDSFIKLVSSEQIESMINAFFSTDAFASNKYSLKTKQQSKPIQHNFLINQKQWSNQIKVAQVLAESETFARTLMATPGNLMHADQFEQEILHKFKNLKNVKISVLHKSDLIKKQMNLLLAVGQASPKCNEPRLIVAEYKSKPNKKKIALIGKGIMFDTGGLNIKPGDHMTAMHLDMTGAAVALSTIYALAKLNVPANLTTLAIATSNDVAPGAYRANDVFKSYSGHTVEILNTDAEGRVALADAIAYAVKDLKADTIATIATLTGAVTVALGNLFTGIWTTSDTQWKMISDAATCAPELVWRMPFHKVIHKTNIDNTLIADITNVSPRAFGNTANTAAEFLHFFAGDSNFIHADIAGTNEFKKHPVAAMLKTMFYFVKDFK